MWEQRYAADEYVYGTEPNDFLVDHVTAITGPRVLCLADGEGRNSVWLAGRGLSVSSVDLTHSGTAKTRSLASARGLSVDAHAADLATFPLGEACWDGIVSIFAHMPPEVRIDLHQRVVKALAPGGVLILEAYTPAQVGRGTGGPQDPALCMTLDALRTELVGLEFELANECVRSVVEGPLHSGDGAVVQVVARKPL
jgi:SAM-dependent methyltransferase